MGSEPQPVSRYVPYFGRVVEEGKRGNVIQEVHFNSRKADIQYIFPTLEELRSGIWIGTRPLENMKFTGILGFGYNTEFDRLVP